MKGILLCGGEGTRLLPLTRVTNKHLLRIGNYPMVEYPLRKMIQAGIDNIHIVTGGENYPPIVKYLGSGKNWGVRITYSIQDRAGGIAEALGLARAFVRDQKMLVVLGDQIFEDDLKPYVKRFSKGNSKAGLFMKDSTTPERFGVFEFDERGVVVDILEKPEQPPSNYVVTGIYMYDPFVFEIIDTLKPSDRGELEISDVNRFYIKRREASIHQLEGEWTDAGTFETLMGAEDLARKIILNDDEKNKI